MSKLRFARLKWVLLVGIIVIAAFLRLYRLDSLPPGADYDQSTYGLDALGILNGDWPVFFPSNFGREPLFSYLVAASFLILGVGPLGIRAASAIVGILTVPAVYLVAEEMFADEGGGLARFGGLLAALILAISYWDITFSRRGLRAVLVPLCVAITLYFLWRTLRTGERWSAIGAGVFLGLSLYTYQVARALPLLALIALAYPALSRKLSRRDQLPNIVLVFVIALIVFAPLGYYFLTHPGSFTQRIEQTLIIGNPENGSSTARALLDKGVASLLMFTFRGDEAPKYNLPGRPELNPFLSVFFLLGIGISLLRFRRPPYLFLLIWLGVMLTPAILAGQGPASKRAIGTTPVVTMLIALGAVELWDGLRRRAARYPPPWPGALTTAATIILAIGFVCSGVLTYRDYFLVWGQDPDLFTRFEAGPAAIGTYVRELPPQELIYLSPVPADHNSVRFASSLRPGIKSYNGRVCMVLANQAANAATYVIVPHDDKQGLDLLQQYFPQGSVVDEGPLHHGVPYFLAYRVPAGAEAHVEPPRRLEANWDNKIRLLGYGLDADTYEPGQTVELSLYLQATGHMGTGYSVFTHLLGAVNPSSGGPLWGQDDSEPCRRFYPTTWWNPGEIVIDTYAIPIPDDAPAGEYQLEAGFYDWKTLERLPVLDTAGLATGDSVTLGQVHVADR